MSSKEEYRFCVGSTDENFDVIGVYKTETEKEFTEFYGTKPLFSTFTDIKDAFREAKRLSIGKNGNGAFYVGLIDKKADYLVFRFDNDDETFDYLTTRSAVAHVLEVNQDSDIPWKTVDAVIQDYDVDKEVGRELYSWLSKSEIIAERNLSAIKKLKFYTNNTRKSAIAY